MILPVLVAMLTALGPLLRGSLDLWAQSLLFLAVTVGLSLWLAFRILIGYLPLPSNRTLIWAGSLAALGAISTHLSPLHALARHPWHVMLNALWLFPAMAALSKDQRSWIDQAIRVSGWILMTLAFYQHFTLGDERPASALLNQNAYAGAILLLLPLAVEKRDWLLSIGLVWTLCWGRSVGAWLGLSLALVLTQRRYGRFWFWSGGVVALACAVAIYGKLASPEVLHRWWWWKASARMAVDRPWFGYGPGAFAYVLPAYLPLPQVGLFSVYAHQHLLETFAEFGIPFGLLWLAGMWRCVVRDSSHKRFGVIAVLIHSLWDYTLSVPSTLWLFSYFAASSIPHSPEGVNIPARGKLPCLVAILLLGAVVSVRILDDLSGQRLSVRAGEAFESGDAARAGDLLEQAARKIPDDPEVPRLQAGLEIRRAQALSGETARAAWARAASHLERAVRLNPYRISGWTGLALAYRRLGNSERAEQVLRESQSYQAARGAGSPIDGR